MAAKKVGDLIKEARTQAGLTQEQLAGKVENVSAADISKAERGEKALTQAALKQIAKATGVTQKSLLEAPAGATAAKKTAAAKTTAKAGAEKTAAKKTTAAKTTAKTAAKTTAKTGAAKTTAAKTGTAKATAAKKTASTTAVKLTAAEKRILELYRKADTDTKKEVEALLKGEKEDGGIVGTLLGGAMDLLNNIGK